jgi:hypothetical protein
MGCGSSSSRQRAESPRNDSDSGAVPSAIKAGIEPESIGTRVPQTFPNAENGECSEDSAPQSTSVEEESCGIHTSQSDHAVIPAESKADTSIFRAAAEPADDVDAIVADEIERWAQEAVLLAETQPPIDTIHLPPPRPAAFSPPPCPQPHSPPPDAGITAPPSGRPRPPRGATPAPDAPDTPRAAAPRLDAAAEEEDARLVSQALEELEELERDDAQILVALLRRQRSPSAAASRRGPAGAPYSPLRAAEGARRCGED